jgi:hypothetical protein
LRISDFNDRTDPRRENRKDFRGSRPITDRKAIP